MKLLQKGIRRLGKQSWELEASHIQDRGRLLHGYCRSVPPPGGAPPRSLIRKVIQWVSFAFHHCLEWGFISL